MGRILDCDDLVDAREAAEIFGYAHPETLHALARRRSDFPDPVVNKGKGRSRLWSRRDLFDWKRQYDKRA